MIGFIVPILKGDSGSVLPSGKHSACLVGLRRSLASLDGDGKTLMAAEAAMRKNGPQEEIAVVYGGGRLPVVDDRIGEEANANPSQWPALPRQDLQRRPPDSRLRAEPRRSVVR